MTACSRLCDLITASLLPYIESKPASFSKEAERDLLLTLSQVSREIKRWTNEIDARSEDQEIIVKQIPDPDHNCFQHLEQSFRGDYNCLANIVSALVAFLSYGSRFVQHISGNILVSVSSFLAQYGSNSVKFLHLLWISLEASVSSICIWGSSTSLVESAFLVDQSLMQCSQHTTDEISVADESICDHTSFIALLQSRLVNTNSLMVAELFQILRRMLKYVKQVSGDLEEKFILLSLSSLLRMPWNEFSTSQMLTSEANSGTKGLLEERTCSERHSEVLLGSVIQLFCSLVEHKDQEDVGGSKEFSLYFKFTNLVSKLIRCFSKQLGSTDQHISGYFRHKVLMLMIRLSYNENWKNSCPTSWLKLLGQYFEDLLYERISEHDAAFGNSLDGSPFLPSFTSGNKVHYPCNRNLQRQAIFLLFKCCFTLSRVSKDTCKGCDCAVESWPSACLVQLCGEDCCHWGLSELFQWLQRSDLLEKILGYEDYFKLCGSFALSFLQLYAEDDDMLLEMLLQLLDAPFTFHVQNNTKDRPLEELKKDTCFLFSSIFNPIHLFHMFLLVLNYDHSVLIDYLISKDTGFPCVKYLLRIIINYVRQLFPAVETKLFQMTQNSNFRRCLRIICESWPTFVNFSTCGTETNQSCYKRRKITRNKDCSRKSSPFRSSAAMFRRQHSGRHKGCSMSKGVNIPTFINAKECLLCLKRSVEELHQKKLFPYNPKPLLCRLSRFQELCEHEECGADITGHV